MFGYSKAPKHLPFQDTLREKSDVTALLDRIATDDDTYDWSERELNELLEIAETMGIDQEANRGLDLVRREMGRRIGMKKNQEYAAEYERMRIRRSPAECIRDIGLNIRSAASSLFRGLINDLKPKKDTRRFRRQSELLRGVERLEDLIYLSGTPIAVEVGSMNPGSSSQTSEQQFQTITESTVLASQEAGSSLALSQATNHFFGDPISLNDGESIEVHAQFTVLENSIGDRMAIAGSRSFDGRNQLQDAMVVEFGKNGSGYLYLKDPAGQEWQISFPMEKVDTGSVIDMRMTYDGTTIAVTLNEDGKEIGSTSAAAPKKYDSLSVGFSNIKWDRPEATDTMQNLSIVKHVTREVPVPVTIPEQSPEEIAAIEAVFSDPNFMDDLNRELYGQPSQESIQSLTSISIEPETQSSAERTPSSVYSLSAHGTAITATDAEILQKQNAVTGINTQILALQAEMQEANILLEQSNAVLTRWSQQQSLESQKVTPTISIETKRFNRFLYVEYTDMPAGCYLTMSGPRVDASDAQYRLNTGNGKAEFEMPHFGVPNRATVELRGPDGKVVTELYSFNHTKDAASRTGAGSESTRIAKLAHAPEIPANMRVSDTEHMNAILDGVAAGTFLTESGDTLTELENSKATLNAEIEALERSRIGAAMMYVTSENTRNSDGPENGLLHVTYTSPHAQTYFEVTIDNDAGAGYRGTVQHASGANNQEFILNVTGLSGSNGNGGVHIRMYADDTKTQLLDSFDASYDRRRREVNGETARDADAFRDGIRIDEHANGDTAYLPIPGLNGNVLMQSWNTNGAQGNMDYDLTEGVATFTAEGTLSSLDFSQTEGTVTDVYADLDIPEGVTVHAMVFRGGVQIGSMEVTRGTPFIFSDVGGFSSILFKTDNPTTLTLNELLVDTNPEELFSAEVLSRAENGTLAGLLATEDFGKIESILVGSRFEYVLGQHNIYNHRGGAAGANGNAYFLLGYGGGTYDTYTLYKPDTTGAGASLGEVRYLNDQGFTVLPQEYYTRINGAIIMHPGAPKNIAVQIASGSGVTAYQAGTSTDIDLLINAQTDFHPEVSVQHLVNGPTSYTGFSNGFNEIGQVSRPVIAAGETFHVVSLVYNNSGVTGQITVEVFTGDDNALVAGDTYTGTIGAYQRAQFTANATSPANATGLPSVRFRVTLPDGTQYWSGGMRSAEAEAAPGEGAGARISWMRGIIEAVADQHGADSAQFRSTLSYLQNTYGSDVVTTAMGQTNVAGGEGTVLSDHTFFFGAYAGTQSTQQLSEIPTPVSDKFHEIAIEHNESNERLFTQDDLLAAEIAKFAYDLDLNRFNNELVSAGKNANWKYAEIPGINLENGRYSADNAVAVVLTGNIDGKELLLIGFRGTASGPEIESQAVQFVDVLSDIAEDVVFIDAHFAKFEPFINAVKTYVDTHDARVIIGGHSLGGTVAQLFMNTTLGNSRYSATTFGSPGALFGVTLDSRIKNVIHTSDVVPILAENRALIQHLFPTFDPFIIGTNYTRSGTDVKVTNDLNGIQAHYLDMYISTVMQHYDY